MKQDRPTIHDVGPGVGAKLQVGLLRGAGLMLAPFRRRGLARLVAAAGRIFGDNYVVFTLDPNMLLKVDLDDPYWVPPLWRPDGYEPEVRYVLERVLTSSSAFVDCGANIGYWSVFAAARIGTAGRVVAVEAAKPVFERLRENAALNAETFRCLNAAVWDRSGDEIDIAVDSVRHSWSSANADIREHLETAGFVRERVRTIAIDDLVDQYLGSDRAAMVVKIDVEGSESMAFAGCRSTFDGGALLIYEDHGRDDVSELSRTLLGTSDVELFFCHPELRVSRMRSPADIRAVKQEAGRGYNFFACTRDSPHCRTLLELESAGPAEPEQA